MYANQPNKTHCPFRQLLGTPLSQQLALKLETALFRHIRFAARSILSLVRLCTFPSARAAVAPPYHNHTASAPSSHVGPFSRISELLSPLSLLVNWQCILLDHPETSNNQPTQQSTYDGVFYQPILRWPIPHLRLPVLSNNQHTQQSTYDDIF